MSDNPPSDKPKTVLQRLLEINHELEEIKQKCPAKVLVVDDSSEIRNRLKEILEKKGYQVVTAEDGAVALSVFTHLKPDLVTLDIMMPVMDGFETLLKMHKIDPNVTILMLTSMEHESLITKCLAMGASGFLTKPVSERQFLAAIHTNIDTLHYKTIKEIFYLFSKILESNLRKLCNTNIEVILVDVAIHKTETPHFGKTEDIKQVPQLSEPFKFQLLDDALGYHTKFSGQLNGVLISIMRKNDANELFGETLSKVRMDELFNLVNQKFISELIRLTQLKLRSEITSQCDQNTIKMLGSEAVVGKFEITDSKARHFEVQLWTNLDVINNIRPYF